VRKRSIIALVNEKVPFPLAARWAGLEVYDDSPGERGIKTYCPFGVVEHPDGGAEPSLRVYADHGWCFAEGRYFSVVSLLAEVWQLDREDAAAEALKRAGYVPASYSHLFEQAGTEPPPDRDALAAALVTWCECWCTVERHYGRPAQWKELQYHPAVSRQLSRCLGLLSLVQAAGDCDIWLSAAKKAMNKVLTAVN
jgi:hypothetical protein